MKGTKLEEQVQNFKESMRNYETKRFFLFRETTRNTLFRISRNDRNSAKQWPVSYSFVFRETKKNTKLSTLVLASSVVVLNTFERDSGNVTLRCVQICNELNLKPLNGQSNFFLFLCKLYQWFLDFKKSVFLLQNLFLQWLQTYKHIVNFSFFCFWQCALICHPIFMFFTLF